MKIVTIKFFILILLIIKPFDIFSQNPKIGLKMQYGGSFFGTGDLSGKSMGLTLSYLFKKRLTFNIGYHNVHGSAGQGEIPLLYGGNYFAFRYNGNPVGFLSNSEVLSYIDNNLYIGFWETDTPERIATAQIFSVGVSYTIIDKNKFSFYTGLNCSILDYEYIFETQKYFVSYKSFDKTLIILTQQGHYLDLGLGYTLGLDYHIFSKLKFGPNFNLFYYPKSGDNVLTYGVALSLNL
ncbi:MAG: hypothetical protein H6567_02090 [Lewinellaceae bacterium]|nr:hypothetical protein [Lewinellaceae bacterium]